MGRDDDGTGPARRPARDEVERLLAERGGHLMRAAVALTGSRHEGEDLLQAALERLLRHWGRIEGDPEGYLRRTLYNMAAAAPAVIAAVGVFAAVTPPGTAPRQPHQAPAGQTAQTTAYVFRHTERALAAAQRENLVEEIHTVGHHYGLGLTRVLTVRLNGGTFHVIEQAGPTASQENIWSYRGQLREQGLDAAGKPVFDASSTTAQSPAGPEPTVMNVSGVGIDYTSKTWWRAAVRLSLPVAPGQSSCTSAYPPPPVGTTVDWPAEIRAALSCGHYRLAGHEQIGAVRAIKLVSEKVDGPYAETLWVDPATYLPVRLTWQWLDHRAQGPGTLTGDFLWVKPTQANLGALRVTVPGGFHQDHAGGLSVPGMTL